MPNPETAAFPAFTPDYKLVPGPVLAARREKAAALCRERDLAGLVLTHCVDIYYLSGTMQEGALFLGRDGEARLLVRRDPDRAAAESDLPVAPVSGPEEMAREAVRAAGDGKLGMPLDVMSAPRLRWWRRNLPGGEAADVTRDWLDMMAVKDAWELEALRRTGVLAAEVYAGAEDILRPGMAECEAAGLFMARAMKLGGINLMRTRGPMESYTWHLISGPLGVMPGGIDAPFLGQGMSPAFPQGASRQPLAPGAPVNLDFGCCLDGYHTDQTRTYCLGPAPEEVHRAHEVLERVEERLVEALVPGAVSGVLYALARDTAREMGHDQGFLGLPGHKIRFVGHGLGLELGGPPYLQKGSQARVREGEVYALELKMHTPEGPVGLETTVAVRPSGPAEILTPIPRVLTELPL